MSAPLVPSPLDYVGRSRFSFYPPIQNAEPNEWMLGSGSWSEVQVVNAATGGELWIPRQYVGAVSEAGGPLLIVGLTKELEFRAGALGPRVKRVIEMPQANENPADRFPRPSGPAPVIGIRIEDREDSPMNKALVTLGISALLISVLAALISGLARL
ncbi:MAG: hypothetical protein WB992_09245 [Bryobacteraceae bacterium]